MTRLGLRMLVLVTTAASVGSQAASASERLLEILPYCNAVLEPVGSTLAEVGAASPHPLVKGAAYTYKATELGLELGATAVAAHETWLEAEILVVGAQAKRLKQIHDSGGDLKGPEATRIKELLGAKKIALGGQREGAAAYTLDALMQHWGYVAVKTGVDKTIDKTLGFALREFGLAKLVDRLTGRPPKLANRLFNYGGPLESLQKDARWDWEKLGTRARLAEKAMAEAMVEQEAKLVASELRLGRGKSLEELADSALGWAYAEALRKNPSRQHVVASDFRLVAARAANLAMEAALQPASAAPVEPARPVAAIMLAPARADRLAVSIASENVVMTQYDAPWHDGGVNVPATAPSEPEPEPKPEAPSVPQVSESTLRFRAELKLIGDGKTFTVCSDGCPASSDGSWDGERGKGLNER